MIFFITEKNSLMSKPIDASHSENLDAIVFVEFLHLLQSLQNYDFCNQEITMK